MRAIVRFVIFLTISHSVMSNGIEPQQLATDYPEYRNDALAVVNIGAQTLDFYRDGKLLAEYPISSAERGAGNRDGSHQTPLGMHYLRDKIGAESPSGMIFKGRIETGKIAKIESRSQHTGEDLITTRILWLSGLEPGVNMGAGVDSYRRFIYIHGTHEEGLIGQPASHGCVRMNNQDVVELFNQLPEKALVLIQE